MLPVLRFAADEHEHTVREATGELAALLGLSESERTQLLPSGQQAVFENRVGWARTYLKKAGFIDNTRRPYFRITQRGLEVLSQRPATIDNAFLAQYPEFTEFRARGEKVEAPQRSPKAAASSGPERTPHEAIEYGYQRLRQELAEELLGRVKNAPPDFFERLVVRLLVRMGYGGSTADAGRAIGRTGDEGIDGVINEDPLGLDVIYIQAKRWQGVVGRPDIQRFVGALLGQRARKGVFITTGTFTSEAKQFANNIDSRVILIDGERLAELLIDNGIGVSTVSQYEIKQVNSDFFAEA